ncbi:MAG: cation-translocating P-type ATPase [Pseudomonadota bacterium]|nr:cation-translocating P-type ATPase [Pseudomonadota bacterium]MDP1902884.1 cation-translocating P-type ATPase [Pseudomonadota bacterium]MDP2351795.1 cation-translocating P-type ATPase [Pseudomonadota bacterium]
MIKNELPAASWHRLTAPEACAELDADPARGLTGAETERRLELHGPNRLAEKPKRPAWLKFVDQFRNVLTGVLVGAALLAGVIGELKDAVVILIVVVFNSALGFHQEYRAEKTLAALKDMLARRARVKRDGRVVEVDVDELVPGDLVLLEAGDRIPADGRFLAAHNVEVDEAALTGESLAVGKHTEPVLPEAPATEVALAERVNMGFMNTTVTRGRAEMLVTNTGMATEMGRLAAMLDAAEEGETPLQKELDRVGKRLAAIAVGVIAIILAVGIAYGQDLVKAILNAVALAVAAIPEGLPAVVTVTLAVGMYRMAQQRAIVKKLAAVETLGSTTVICSDKTGTLTLNQMTARALYFRGRRFQVSGEGYEAVGKISAEDAAVPPDFAPLLLPMALCSESRVSAGKLIGDPTEGALLALAAKGGVEPETALHHRPRIAEIPFDSAHKFMATFHHEGERVLLLVKGAPDVLLTHSSRWAGPAGEAALDATAREALLAENERLAARAFRVLAVASRSLPARDFDPGGDLFAWVTELEFQGLAGIQDPPRPEAKEAIALCRQAGIQVKMITGDHKITATAIARELGLTGEGLNGEVMSGAELDAVSAHELAATIERVAVFARVAPEHKVKIVAALKELGHVVAMTGDGVNDAPALKTADIGIAMGITGTEVTREAAAMVLADDNFATIVRAVREGRTIFENIIKFVRFQLATNIGAILTVSTATFMGLPAPFTAIQILWINIIMDGPPAMSLGVDPPRIGVMDAAPRAPGEAILSSPRIGRLAQYGLTMAVGTLGVFWWALQAGDEARAMTLAFTTFVLFQFFNVMNARNETGSAFNRQFFSNGKLWLALIVVLVLQAVAVHWGPAQDIFHTVDLSLNDWVLAWLIAASVLVLEEARKLVASRRG